MALHSITQGDDVALTVALTENCEAVEFTTPASPARVWTAALTNLATDVTYGPATLSETDSGWDLANGIIVVRFPTSLSATFPLGASEIDVQVEGDDGSGTSTWQISDVDVVKDRIANL